MHACLHIYPEKSIFFPGNTCICKHSDMLIVCYALINPRKPLGVQYRKGSNAGWQKSHLRWIINLNNPYTSSTDINLYINRSSGKIIKDPLFRKKINPPQRHMHRKNRHNFSTGPNEMMRWNGASWLTQHKHFIPVFPLKSIAGSDVTQFLSFLLLFLLGSFNTVLVLQPC